MPLCSSHRLSLYWPAYVLSSWCALADPQLRKCATQPLTWLSRPVPSTHQYSSCPWERDWFFRGRFKVNFEWTAGAAYHLYGYYRPLLSIACTLYCAAKLDAWELLQGYLKNQFQPQLLKDLSKSSSTHDTSPHFQSHLTPNHQLIPCDISACTAFSFAASCHSWMGWAGGCVSLLFVELTRRKLKSRATRVRVVTRRLGRGLWRDCYWAAL